MAHACVIASSFLVGLSRKANSERREASGNFEPRCESRHDSTAVVVPTIETARLTLRSWRASDLNPYSRLVADPEVMRHLFAFPGPLDRDQAREDVARIEGHWRQHGFGHWAVELKAARTLIGRIGLLHHPDWPEDADDVEVGWVLDRGFWGRGLATEGGIAAIRYGFAELGLPRIISFTSPSNVASRRVMEKVGLAFARETEWRGEQVVWYAGERATWEVPLGEGASTGC